MDKNEERKKNLEAQVELARQYDSPVFMPLDGYCMRCDCDIAKYYGGRLAKEIVTGCPNCGRTYCE